MKKFITLVFEYSTDEELKEIRKAVLQENCRAWSMDHEILRVDLMGKAIEANDIKKAEIYCSVDGVIKHREDMD